MRSYALPQSLLGALKALPCRRFMPTTRTCLLKMGLVVYYCRCGKTALKRIYKPLFSNSSESVGCFCGFFRKSAPLAATSPALGLVRLFLLISRLVALFCIPKIQPVLADSSDLGVRVWWIWVVLRDASAPPWLRENKLPRKRSPRSVITRAGFWGWGSVALVLSVSEE